MLGYDKRYGSGSARGHSDTLMLIRVDPKTKILSLLSLPRDLYVNVPGMGMRKINDAYAYGGAPLAIQTVSQVLGVKINYYVPVNFHLFRKTVDIFHGVYIDVDRRYYHANNSAGNYAAIDLQPGYQKLSGFAALQYVRYRHLDSDFMRTARQQAFVREFKRRLDVWSAGTNIFSLLDTLPNDLKVRGSAKGQSVGPKTILRYIKLLAEIPRGNMVQVRLTGDTPTLSNGASVVTVSPQAIQSAVAEFQNPNPAISQSVASRIGGIVVGGAKKPAKKKIKGPKPIPPTRLRVVTVNGSGVQSVATQAKVELQKAGWPHTSVGRHPAADEPLLDPRLLHEPPRAALGREAAALAGRYDRIGAPAGLDDRLRPQRRRRRGDRQRILRRHSAADGRQPSRRRRRRSARSYRPRRLPTPATSSSTRRRSDFKLLYPSKVPLELLLQRGHRAGSNAFRVYPLGKHGKAMAGRRGAPARLLERLGPALHDLDGRADPRAADAPGLLGQASQVASTRTARPIHRIAVFYGGEQCKAAGGVVVWIDNSLDDKLSPETMIAIARSLVPAHRAPAA